MTIGQLDTRITIQSQTKRIDGLGQAISDYADEQTVWANIKQTGSGEGEEANRLQGSRSFVITVRHYATLSNRHRIRLNTDILEITGITNTGRRQFTQITAISREKQ